MKPDRIEFKVGQTIFGQQLRLVYARDYAGRRSWTLHKDPVSQRDESQQIDGLTSEAIRAMADATKGID